MKHTFIVLNQMRAAGVLDPSRLDALLARHSLLDKWETFGKRFLTPDQP